MADQIHGTREWRVSLAVKWAYLDHLNAPEIVDRFKDELGIELSVHTVRDYLQEKEAQQVRDQIKDKHANTRLQIADREERKHKRAREDEKRATKNEPIRATIPETATVEQGVKEVQAWKTVTPDDEDYPEWATDRDTVIRFVDNTVFLEPGDKYPIKGIDGAPRYTTKMVGLNRDHPDIQTRMMARREQSQHLEAKGEVLGVYEETINIEGDVEHSIDEDSEGALLGAIGELRDQSE